MGAVQSQTFSRGTTHDPHFPSFTNSAVTSRGDGSYLVTIVIPQPSAPKGVSSTCEVVGTADDPTVLWQGFVDQP